MRRELIRCWCSEPNDGATGNVVTVGIYDCSDGSISPSTRPIAVMMTEVSTIEAYGAKQLDGTRETSVVLTLCGAIAIVLLTILGVGATACLLPARRASRIDPLLVIRE